MNIQGKIICSFAVLLFLVVTGCSEYTSTVTGTVTHEGEGVTAGSVIFRPVGVDVKPAAGVLGDGGKFEARTAGNEGIKPGQYKLLYVTPAEMEGQEAIRKWGMCRAPEETITVENGENVFPIELVRH